MEEGSTGHLVATQEFGENKPQPPASCPAVKHGTIPNILWDLTTATFVCFGLNRRGTTCLVFLPRGPTSSCS